jgi:hypothetical protein
MFSVDDIENYKFDDKLFSNKKDIEEFINNAIRTKDKNKMVECIQILYYLLSSNEIIYNDRIDSYIFPDNEMLNLALLLDLAYDKEKIHIDNIKVGDIVERHEINKYYDYKILYYKVVKITNKYITFKPYRKNRKYTGITIFEEDEKQKNIRMSKIYVASIFYNGGHKILENDKHLIRVKPLLFDTLYK